MTRQKQNQTGVLTSSADPSFSSSFSSSFTASSSSFSAGLSSPSLFFSSAAERKQNNTDLNQSDSDRQQETTERKQQRVSSNRDVVVTWTALLCLLGLSLLFLLLFFLHVGLSFVGLLVLGCRRCWSLLLQNKNRKNCSVPLHKFITSRLLKHHIDTKTYFHQFTTNPRYVR